MFDNISLENYDLLYELQGSQFFKDCLNPEIDFQLKNGSVSVYKQLDSGISEEISVDELIYFIQYDVAKYIKEERERCRRACSPPRARGEVSGGRRANVDKEERDFIASIKGVKNRLHILDKYNNQSFRSIDSIRNAVENMKILLKYGEKKKEEVVEKEVVEDKEEDEEKEEPLMTEVSTVKIG